MAGKNVRSTIVRVLAWAIVTAGLGIILERQFAGLSLEALERVLREIGWLALLLILPGFLLTLTDGFGWLSCLAGRRRTISVRRMFALRIAGDAVCNSVPAGVAPGEGLRSVLARDRCGVPLDESLSACLLGRVTMGLAQLIFLFAVMIPLLTGIADTIHPEHLPGGTAGLLTGTLLTTVFLAGPLLLFTGPRLSQLLRAVIRIPIRGIRTCAVRAAPSITRMDTLVRAFAREHRADFWKSVLLFFGGWMALGAESALILALLGVKAPLVTGFAMEAIISVLRMIFFFLPSAMGAAEVAYTTILVSLGIPDAVTMAAAFIALKRSREFLWVCIGYGTLGHLWSQRKAAPSPAS